MSKFPGYLTWALLLASLFAATGVYAAQVEGLYSASVVVSERGEGEQSGALNRALARVLVKVSGTNSVLHTQPGQAALAAALRNARALVQSFDYQDRNERIYLHAVFDARSIDRLLSGNGLSVWGSERPATLVWLAIDQQGKRFLLPAGSAGVTAKALYRAAALRGIPVNLPIMDLDDRKALSYSDVAGGFSDRVIDASARYGDRSVLIGRLSQIAAGQWDVSWTYLLSSSEQTWSSRGQSLAAAIASGINRSSDVLAARYAAKAGVSNTLSIQVEGIAGIADYARALNYLQSLSIVSAVQILVLDKRMNRYQVDVQGDQNTFRDVVSLQSVLQLNQSESSDSHLVFDLQP